MGYPDWIGGNPQKVLEEGTKVVTLPDKVRLFAVRKVAYDDSMTPLYASPLPFEHACQSLTELYKEQRDLRLCEAPVLDVDNHLKVYDDERN